MSSLSLTLLPLSLLPFTVLSHSPLAEKCKSTDSVKLCQETKISEIVVNVGRVGTNDDVFLEICPDVKAKCCKTKKPLDKRLNNDWQANAVQTWGASELGECGTKTFTVSVGNTW